MICYNVNRQGIEQQQSLLHNEQKDIDKIVSNLNYLLKTEQVDTDTYRVLEKCVDLSDEIKDNILFRKQFLIDLPDKLDDALSEVKQEIEEMEKSARETGKLNE